MLIERVIMLYIVITIASFYLLIFWWSVHNLVWCANGTYVLEIFVGVGKYRMLSELLYHLIG